MALRFSRHRRSALSAPATAPGRAYLFCNRGSVTTAAPMTYPDPLHAFANRLPFGEPGPQLLCIRRDYQVTQWYPWSQNDSAALGVFAAQVCANAYAHENPAHHRLQRTLDSARAALRVGNDADTMVDVLRAGRILNRTAQRISTGSLTPATTQSAVWAVSMAALALDWKTHPTRADAYVQSTLKIATSLDPHLPTRLKLWVDSHLRTRHFLMAGEH